MDYEGSMHDWERLLHDKSAGPKALPPSILRAITNDFAPDRKTGEDGFFEIYKGVLQNEIVVVKKLREMGLIDDRFHNELHCLMRLKHKNIVRFLGYCNDLEMKVVKYKGQLVFTDVLERLLCFEYLKGGNLDAYITEASLGLAWRERYKIIKGICEGIHYLHQNLTVHLDLKPTNIWLDGKNVPKIHDFGGSMRLEENQSEVFVSTEHVTGTPAYMAPEFIGKGLITFKADIYSLGVLITQILTGEREYSIVGKILQSWADRLGTSLEDKQLQQVRVCAAIGISCLHKNHKKRPDAASIIKMLVETESTDEFTMPDYVQTMELNMLEHIVSGSEEPRHLDLSLLQSITDNFSEHRKIGIGGCGEVYKGILRNGVVAVKRLFKSRTIKDKMFHREVQCLFSVRNENIVRFLGYCSFTEERVLVFQGRTIMADIRERLLCFEYISNGNLENHLTDELRGLEWLARYEIIVGICKGLLYLHKEKGIVHMDLKPSNILLDDRMVPKITDFGLSRLDNINSQTLTASRLISLGYCAPEYVSEGKSSSKSDIYSLGVIITELVTGSKNMPDLTKVLRRWRHRWSKSWKHTHLGYQQVTECLELAQRCIQIDPAARPDIVYIMHELDTIDSNDVPFEVIPCLEDMLGIEPLELHFPFELDQQMSHSIDLTNDTDDYIAFMTKSRHFHTVPDKSVVPPRSKCRVTITIRVQVNALPNRSNHYKITVLSTRVDGGLADMDITGDMFIEKEGNVVDEMNVMVVFDTPQSGEES